MKFAVNPPTPWPNWQAPVRTRKTTFGKRPSAPRKPKGKQGPGHSPERAVEDQGGRDSPWVTQRPPVNRGNRGKAGVCGAKIRWSSQKFQPLMSRFPSGAVEFSHYLAEFLPCLAKILSFLEEFTPCLAEIFPRVAEFSTPNLAKCFVLPVWRNFCPVR